MLNDWAHSYRTVANAMKQTADTSGAEPFNPFLKGGVSGAKFNALGATADYSGKVLGAYAGAVQQHQEEQARAAAAEQNRQNELERQNALGDLKAQADLIAKSDDLKTSMATSLFGAKDSKGNPLNKDDVNAAINLTMEMDKRVSEGQPLNDIFGLLDGLDTGIYSHLADYAVKSYNLYNPGNTFQEMPAEPAPPKRTIWGDIGKGVNWVKGAPSSAGSYLGGIKSYLGG